MTTIMHDELPERLIENIVTLPTIPPVLAELNSAIADPNSSGADIARIISRDPSTATKVLRVANSAYYGLRNKVTTINHAVTMLGFKIIRNMVMTATVFEGSSSSDIGGLFDTESFWRHSLGAGIAAQVISREALRLDKRNDDFFICGLLHDLGKIIFSQSLQDRFQQALQMSRDKGMSLFEAEKQVIGCTHAEVGGLLAKRWNLSQEVIATLHFHHLPLRAPENFKNHALVTHLADFMARKKGIGSGGGSDPDLDRAAWDALKLSKRAIPGILSEIDNILRRQNLESMSSDST
jgi:HD-like signal output (HDOD) protein